MKIGVSRNSLISRLMATAPVAIGLFAATSAVAQERPNEEIVVTAGKLGEADIQSIATNISAVGADQLAKTGAVTLDDVVRQVPGVSVTGGQGNKTVIIRGLAASAGAPQVGIYLDETPLSGVGGTNVRQSDIGLYDIERVEVLRGPQGTLYGGGSQGGTIRYITNKPNDDIVEGAVGARVGLRARDGGMRYEGNAMLNAPVVNDVLAVRAVGFWRHVDGFVDIPALSRDGSDDEETYGGRLLVQLKPTTSTTLLLTGIYQKTALDDSSLTLVDEDRRTNAVLEPYLDKLKLFNATLEQETGIGTLTATLATYRRDTNYVFDQSQFVSPSLGSINQTGRTDATTGELRFASKFEGPFQVIAGGFFENRDAETASVGQFVDPDTGLLFNPPDPFFTSLGEQYLRNRALFVNATFDITDRLTIEGGLRYFEMKRRNESRLTQDLFGRPLGPAPTQRAQSDGFVKKAQLSYKATEDVLVYGTFSQGFREGGPNNPALLGNYPLTFGPDFVDNFELGWKSTLFGRQLVLNGAVYYMKWNDIQVSQRDPTGAFAFTSNAGKADLKGAEIEGRLSPYALPGLSINFALRYSDQKLTEDNPLVVGPPGDPFAGRKGERIPFTSKFGANFGIEQRFPLAGMDGFIRGDMSYSGPAYTTFSTTDPQRRRIESLLLADARIGVEEERWSASLYVRNIFNRRAVTLWSLGDRSLEERVRTSEPREAGLQVAFNF